MGVLCCVYFFHGNQERNLACLTLLRLVLVLCSESNSSVESSREKCLKESGYNVYVRDNDTYNMCDIYKYMIYNC